jgi:hypothetical protein
VLRDGGGVLIGMEAKASLVFAAFTEGFLCGAG